MADLEIKKEIVKKKKVKKRGNKIGYLFLWFILGVLIIVSMVALFFNLKASGYLDKFFLGDSAIYFISLNLGNGNAFYYGQIINDNEEFIILKNPGYINIEEAAEEGENPVISFRQMKDESIKPLPEMKIYKHNIIFIQELSTDSSITRAYEDTNK
jgi:hypothetical protein